MKSDINAIILTLMSIIISLFALYFQEYRIIVISLSLITFAGYILLIYITKVENNEKQILELKKNLKRMEDLTNIRADIKYLKKVIK